MKKIEIDKEELTKLLNGKLTIKEISEILKVRSRHTISKKIKQYKLSHLPTKGHRKNFFNEDFFEVINTEEKAYWLGMIAADGCIHTLKRNKKKRISLGLKDEEHLKKFGKAIKAGFEPNKRERFYNEKTYLYYSYKLRSGKMFSDLNNHQITERKSLTLKPPTNLPQEMIRHWIRGYFDGDGCIHINKRGKMIVSIAGTEVVMDFIKNQVGFGRTGVSIKGRINPLFHYRTGVQSDIQVFYQYLYKNSTVSMDRKKRIFEVIISKDN